MLGGPISAMADSSDDLADDLAAGSEPAFVSDEAVSVLTRIIGGRPSALGDFPANVALLRNSPTNTLFERQFCGGTAISDNYILTAAHCLFNLGIPADPADILIAGNFVDLNNDSPAELALAEIIIHPNYDNESTFSENDIALLRTEIPHNIPSVSLFSGDVRELTGAQGFITGWGLTQLQPPIFASVLNEAEVPVTDFDVCNDVYNRGLGIEHVCAGFQAGGVDACQGDSGSPLMIMDGTEIIQIGITSFGEGCAFPDAYGVYTNVENYESWVSGIVPVPSSGRAIFRTPVETFEVASSGSSDDSFLGSTDVGLLTLLIAGFGRGFGHYLQRRRRRLS